jgi:hypothetical protein
MKRLVALVGASASVVAAVAFAADPVVREGNLDRDPARERVHVEDVYPDRPAEAPLSGCGFLTPVRRGMSALS